MDIWKDFLNLHLTIVIKHVLQNLLIRQIFPKCACMKFHKTVILKTTVLWKSFSYDWSVAIDVMDERNLLRYGSEIDFGKNFWTSIAPSGHELSFNTKNKSHFVNMSYIWHVNQLVCNMLWAITHTQSSLTIIKNKLHSPPARDKGLNH